MSRTSQRVITPLRARKSELQKPRYGKNGENENGQTLLLELTQNLGYGTSKDAAKLERSFTDAIRSNFVLGLAFKLQVLAEIW